MCSRHAMILAFSTIGLIAGVAGSHSARADVIFSGVGNNGAPLSATVDFSLIGNVFQIVLTNNNPSLAQASVLTNLEVTVAPAPATKLPSASGTIALTSGSLYVGAPPTYTLGQEWAYLSGGLASSGFGVGTGHGNLCGETDASLCTSNQTKQALGGAAYGLVGFGTTDSTGNSGLKFDKNPYIENSVTVDITLASNSSFSLSDLSSVQFQYGTSPGEGSITVNGCTGGSDCQFLPPPNNQSVPEPSSLALLGFGVAAFGWYRRRGA